MASCFSDNVIEPVIIVDVLRDHGEKGERVTKRLCSNSEQVEWAVKETHDQDLHVRFISICQRNSWRPLQITQDMFEGIVKHHGLNQSAYELSSCFYTRNLNREEAFCVPLSLARTGSSIDISYTMRYPEFKAHENRWTQRQTGIYHRFNEDTGQHFILLISPLPNSLGHRKIEEQLLNFDQPFPMDDLWVHSVLFSNYLPPWRQYMAWLENLLLPITNLSLVAEINRETRVKYDHLNTVYDLNNRLVQIPTLFHHSSDTLEGLLHCSGRSGNSTNPARQKLENCRRQAVSYSRTAAYLQQRAQTTAELLFETLSLRDQTVTKIQTETMTNMSRSAYCIAIMGLFYLPTTLVATVFGANFIILNDQGTRTVLTADIWIFLVVSIVLTLITFFVCHFFQSCRSPQEFNCTETPKRSPGWSQKTVKWNAIVRRLWDRKMRVNEIPLSSPV